jgi:hypothetical protein
MILFACDWCRTIKQRGETWILGLAAESIGATAARREINILTGWDEGRACHPLAVQFCSVEHKDRYMAAMFETEPLPPETIIEEKTTVAPNRTSERRYMRTVSTGVVGTSKKKKKAVSSKRGRAA